MTGDTLDLNSELYPGNQAKGETHLILLYNHRLSQFALRNMLCTLSMTWHGAFSFQMSSRRPSLAAFPQYYLQAEHSLPALIQIR